MYAIFYVTVDFLIIQMDRISIKILNEFTKKPKNQDYLKREESASKVLKLLGAFAYEFRCIDKIYTNLISTAVLGTLVCALVFPYFVVFTDNLPFIAKVLMLMLYISSLLLISTIFFFSDHFKRKVNLFLF